MTVDILDSIIVEPATALTTPQELAKQVRLGKLTSNSNINNHLQ